MSARKGFSRVCVILNILVGLLLLVDRSLAAPNQPIDPFTLKAVAVLLLLPWLIYWAGVYIAKGFTRK